MFVKKKFFIKIFKGIKFEEKNNNDDFYWVLKFYFYFKLLRMYNAGCGMTMNFLKAAFKGPDSI